jgi:DNA repair protein RadD
LREDYDDMLVAAQPSELIAAGHILAPRVFTVPPDKLPDLRGLRVKEGEFAGKELERRVNHIALLGDIVDHWKRRAERRPTLAFACSTAHSKSIVERFNAAGIRASHIDGDTPTQQRADTLDALREDFVDVVSSCDLLAEGIDILAIKCVIMARPTASLVVSNQQGGRCMRPIPGTNATAMILDHAGNIVRHGYPHADREWTLDGLRMRKGRAIHSNSAGAPRACAACHEVVPPGPACASCGAKLGSFDKHPPTDEFVPAELPGHLVDVASAIPIGRRLAEYQRLASFAQVRGFGEGWADKVYRLKFDEARPVSIES